MGFQLKRNNIVAAGPIVTQPVPKSTLSNVIQTKNLSPSTSLQQQLGPSGEQIVAGLLNQASRQVQSARSTIISDHAARALLLQNPSLRPGSANSLFLNQPIRTLPTEFLELSTNRISNSNFTTENLFGISSQRPQLISFVDFFPVYDNNSKVTAVGNFLDIQFQARQLRSNYLADISKKLSDKPELQSSLNSIQSIFNDNFSKVSLEISKKINFFALLQQTKDSLNLKTYTSDPTNDFMSLQKFYSNVLSWSPEQFLQHSNTKILYQVLNDFKTVCENYTPLVADGFDYERMSNTSVTNIDTDILSSVGFSFKKENLSPNGDNLGQNTALNTQFFDSFISSLPTDGTVKIKLLSTLIAREMGVSFTLCKPEINTMLATEFATSANAGSPFNNIIGEVGPTMFSRPKGPKSLASVTFLETPDKSTFVLPFETRFIDKDNNTVHYLPGSTYLVDTILSTVQNGSFNVQPFLEFSDQYSRTFANVDSAITSILFPQDYKFAYPSAVLSRYYLAVKNLLESCRNSQNLNFDLACLLSICKQAILNPKLKQALYQYFVLAGIVSVKEPTESTFFKRMFETEVKTLNSFSIIHDNIKFSRSTYSDTENNVVGANTTLGELLTSNTTNVFTAISKVASYVTDLFLKSVLPNYDSELSALYGSENLSQFSTIGVTRVATSQTSSEFPALNRTNIQAVLERYLYDSPLDGSIHSVVREFVSIMNSIESSLQPNQYQINDGSGRTKYNQYTYSTMCLLNFELFINCIDQLITVSPYLGPQQNTVVFYPFVTPNEQMYQYLSVVTNTSVVESGASATDGGVVLSDVEWIKTNVTGIAISPTKKNVIDSITVGVNDSNKTIKNFLNIFATINNKLLGSATKLRQFFSGLNAVQSVFVNNQEAVVISDAQIKLSKSVFDSVVNVFNQNVNATGKSLTDLKLNSYDSDYIDTPSMQTVFGSMMNEPFFKKKGLKFITVGLPNKFSEHLLSKVNGDNLSAGTFTDTENDLIYINVYKRDYKNEDVIFKPKQFIFNLSWLGINDTVLPPPSELVNRTFKSLIDQNIIQFKDYESINSVTSLGLRDLLQAPSPSNFNKFQTYTRFSNLSEIEKRELIVNHSIDFFAAIYTRLVTGAQIDEESFIIKPITRAYNDNTKTTIEDAFQLFLRTFVKDITGTQFTVEELRKNNPRVNALLIELSNNDITNTSLTIPTVPDAQKIDLDKILDDFVNIFSSTGFLLSPNKINNKILAPKLFDRVFTVAVDPDDFEIDEQEMLSTPRAKDLLGQESFLNRTIRDQQQSGYSVGGVIVGRSNEQDPSRNLSNLKINPEYNKNFRFEDYFVTIETYKTNKR